MRQTTIYSTPNFTLISFGNGTAYDLRHAGHSVFVQDEDATTFRDAFDAWFACRGATVESALANLWSDYACVATVIASEAKQPIEVTHV